MPRNARNPRTKRAPARKRALKRVSRPRNTLIKTIKSVLHSQIEDKIYTTYGSNNSIKTCQAAIPYFVPLVPLVNQGVGDNQRIGNSVNVVSGKIRGYINLKPWNSVTAPYSNDVYVKFWLGKRKGSTNQNTALTVTDFSTFFNLNASAAAFQGNMLDMMFYPNTETWTIFNTKQQMLSNGNNLQYAAQSAQAGANSASARCSVPFSFDFTKHLGKLLFDDNVSGYPTNKELYLFMTAVDAQGTTYGNTTELAELHYVLDIKYEDA